MYNVLWCSSYIECPICLDVFKMPLKTKCGHMFCKGCIEEALRHDSYCPTCKKPLRPITGKQPPGGTMTSLVCFSFLAVRVMCNNAFAVCMQILNFPVPGYEGCNTIKIQYTIPGGVQGPEHPNPGQRYTGTSRTAYLPDNQEGREVLRVHMHYRLT